MPPMHLLPRGALAAAAAFLIAAGTAHATQPGTTVIVDQPSGFTDTLRGAGNQSVTRPAGAISATGRYVVFTSDADGLSAADDDRHGNVYRKDRLTGEVVLVSAAGDGKPANAGSYGAQISDDGNRVAFISYASNLDPSTEPGERYAFVRDIAAGTTTLVSRSQGRLGEPGTVDDVAISGDGRTVAFTTYQRMQLEDKNGAADVYARRDGDTILVSRANGADGAQTSSYSYQPALCYDGLCVAFTTAGKLSDADTNGVEDVYRRNIGTGATRLISARDGDGKAGNGPSSQPALSAGGESVAFTSEASDLDAQQPSDSGGRRDVFVRVGGDQRILSHDLPLAGVKASQFPDISGDFPTSVHVAFTSYLEGDVAQVLVRDVMSSTLQIASRAGVNGPLGDSVSTVPSISDSGSVVAFTTAAHNLGRGIGGDATDVAVRDLAAGTTTLSSAPPSGPLVEDLDYVELHSSQGQLTPDARFAVFEAGHDGLGPADRGSHVFRRNVRSGTTIRVDRGNGPSGTPALYAWSPSASADGRLVAFTTDSRLVPADTNAYDDVYVRDVVANTTRLVSRTPRGVAGNNDSDTPVISADGRRVAFESDASDLGDGDADADVDVHVLDLRTGAMIYASRAAAPADGESYSPTIDADGSAVAFASSATNLDPADADTMTDVFVRDIAAGTTRVVSRSSAGTKGNQPSTAPAISADGRHVAFESQATTLDDDTDLASDVFVRDTRAGTTRLVSRAGGATGTDFAASAGEAAISADGRAVSFRSAETGSAAAKVFVRRLDDLTTTRIADGVAASLSGDGSCEMFKTSSREIVRSSPDYERVALRALRPTCNLEPIRRPGGGSGGGGAQDPAPRITRASLLRTRFAVGGPHGRRGTMVRFSLSEPATVALTIHRRGPGRLQRKGTLRRSGIGGRNRVSFTGRVRGRGLAPGRYRLTLVARDARGQHSAPVRLGFRIVRP